MEFVYLSQGIGVCSLLLRLDASHNDIQGLGSPPSPPSWTPHSVRPVSPDAVGSERNDRGTLSSVLSGCTLLQFLNLSCNAVSQLESLLIAAPYCPGLLSLDLRLVLLLVFVVLLASQCFSVFN